MYNDNWSLLSPSSYGYAKIASAPNATTTPPGAINPSSGAAYSAGGIGTGSNALFFQRLRVQTEFKVAEGLTLVTRFDAMEKKWGDQTWVGTTAYDNTNRPSSGSPGARVQENIEFNRVYVDFTTKIGRFLVGYQEFGTFGTVFLDTSFDKPGLKWYIPMGPFTMGLAYDKVVEGESATYSDAWRSGGIYSDRDKDEFYIFGTYKFGAGDAGALFEWIKNASARGTAATASNQSLYLIDPYVKMKIGPVYFEAEALYGFGDYAKWDNPSITTPVNKDNITLSAWALYMKGEVALGPAYFGGIFAYVSGDDPSTTNKLEGGVAAGLLAGQNWSPTLIMKNDDHATLLGNLYGNTGATSTGGSGANGSTTQFMDNIIFLQAYGGFKPTPKLDVQLKLAYAVADKKPWVGGVATQEYSSSTYGTEADLIATYKIFDNLEYMAGFGYFWTGDYYRGYDPNNKVSLSNDYMLMHKLTLSF